MKLSLYEKLLRYHWFHKAMSNFTLMEYFVIFAFVIGMFLYGYR